MKFNTQLLHGNAIKRYPDGATLPPISQVSAFAYETAQDLEKVFNNSEDIPALLRLYLSDYGRSD